MATAQLDVDSNKFNLPVVKASAGPDGIVVSKLRNDGWVTLDPGFLTTAQCESKITYIDGKHSILRYCGYPHRATVRELRFSGGGVAAAPRRAAEQG